MEAGTFDIIWLRPIDQKYSLPATAFFKKPPMAGFADMDDENTKKHKK